MSYDLAKIDEELAAHVPKVVTIEARTTPAGTAEMAKVWSAEAVTPPSSETVFSAFAGDVATGYVVARARTDVRESDMALIAPSGEITNLPVTAGWPYAFCHSIVLATRLIGSHGWGSTWSRAFPPKFGKWEPRRIW